jgi:DNA-binding winged helix-turn-helix (wHTH) protein
MDARADNDVYRFESFRLDRRGGGLFRLNGSGDFVRVAVGTRAIDVLSVLVARHRDVISRDDLLSTVWPATTVEEKNLTVQISALRRVLDEGRAEGSCIQTVPGRGYRFLPPVTAEPISPLRKPAGPCRPPPTRYQSRRQGRRWRRRASLRTADIRFHWRSPPP